MGHTFDAGGAGGDGVFLDSVENVTVKNLTLTNFDNGIFLAWANNCTISNNSTSGGGYSGIGVWGGLGNIISGNTIANNYDGIDLVLSSNSNTVRNNTISDNLWGMWIYSADNNLIYNNNFVGNTYQGDIGGSGNAFNQAQPVGGNYWDNWTSPDANADGFVDNPYVVGPGGTDALPWVSMNGWWCVDPQLSLSKISSYWADYAEYEAGHLSVDYSIANSAEAAAYNVQIVGTKDTNGVYSLTPLPTVGEIAPHSSSPITVSYYVPAGVAAFNSKIYATAADSCGNIHSYPGPWPGA